jgi:hypothetical protein
MEFLRRIRAWAMFLFAWFAGVLGAAFGPRGPTFRAWARISNLLNRTSATGAGITGGITTRNPAAKALLDMMTQGTIGEPLYHTAMPLAAGGLAG